MEVKPVRQGAQFKRKLRHELPGIFPEASGHGAKGQDRRRKGAVIAIGRQHGPGQNVRLKAAGFLRDPCCGFALRLRRPCLKMQARRAYAERAARAK